MIHLFNVFLASGVHTPEHTRQEQWLKGIFSSILLLSLHPRTNITVAVQIVYDDGCLASALVNCVTLGIVIFCLFRIMSIPQIFFGCHALLMGIYIFVSFNKIPQLILEPHFVVFSAD